MALEGRKSGEDNRSLFESLYEQAFPIVYNYVYFRVLDAPTAEDITAETFYRAWRSFERFDSSRAKFSTWAVTIARNAMTDHWRRSKIHGDIDDVPESLLSAEDHYPTVGPNAEQAKALLAVLSDEERELVYLKYYNDMRNLDIAETLGMNASTVSTKLARALKKMRDHARDSKDGSSTPGAAASAKEPFGETAR